MKSFAVAALVSVVVANPGLVDGLLGKTGLDLDVKLPAGISIGANLGPKYPPPSGCTNVWHPPHHGVDMDGCDNHGDDDWHYVHPCDVCQTEKHHTWTTSTDTATITKTITDCPETVTDCPARTSVVVTATTTICPVEVTHTQGPTSTIVVVPTTTMAPNTMITSYCEEETTQAPPAPPATTSVVIVQPPPAGGNNGNQPPAGGNNGNQPPAGGNPPAGNNGTMTMPPITGAGARTEAGIVAAFGAVVALFL